jgi:predicted MPP superfamily phosphohydrolase
MARLVVDQLKSKTLLRILHVSDIHFALECVSHLKERLQAEKIDIILSSGDNADMAMDYNASPETIKKYEEDMRQVVQSLEAIHPLVIYIPGNHDPITTFDDKAPEMTSQSINLHKQCIQLAPNLRLIGFGGSIPGFQNEKKTWDGFPFPTEYDFAKEFMPFVEQLPDFTGSTIFMTHIGPEKLGLATESTKF